MAPWIDEPTNSKRKSVLLSNNNVWIDDYTSNSSTSVQKAGTELASNSQVDDLGNGKHLEQQEDSEDSATDVTASSRMPADFLVTKTGTGFGLEDDPQQMSGDLDAFETQPSSTGYDESLLENEAPGTQDTTLTEGSGSLGDELREAYRETASKQRSDFLPIDALDRIVTEDRVREEIEKFSTGPYDDLEENVQKVLGASTIAGQITSRKKIFAILALTDKLEAIWDFVREGIHDIHLPFEKEKAQTPDGTRKSRLGLCRRSDTGGSTRIPIKAFHGWTGSEVTNFERTQWDVHIPIFFLNTKKEPRVRHYPLQESVVLPFIEDDEVKQGVMGGFADVWRVKFHPSHHNHGVLASGRRENPAFAIKRLHYMDEKAFRKEVQNLKRFSTRDYLHLIKLLGTYEWRHQYYLIFPWADGNLLDFWERHAEPLAHKRDISTALWFSEQCLGLVEGMKMIHTWDTPDADGHHHGFSFPIHQIHGLHGDLKPQNILWFKQHAENTGQNSSSLGHFKISDFGLTHFHGTKSIADIDAKDTGFSPTYRAPERDVKGRVTQSYDVWSLACVLLEFASWYLGGYEEVKSFGTKRMNEDMQYDCDIRQDRFFNFMRASQVMPDDSQGRAQICAVEKISVVEEFEKLYDDPYCSDYMVDFLELVQKSLLRLGPEKRRGCTVIAESLQKLHDNLRKDSSYGIYRVKKPPSRSPTLDSVLMEGDVSPEFKRQIRKSLPRRSLSFDRDAACNSTSLSAALSSSPSSSLINLVSSTGRDPRPTSPERKGTFRLSTDLSTVQESPGTQAQEELNKDQHSHQDTKAAANENSIHAEGGHILSTGIATGLNIIDDEASHLKNSEEHHRRLSDAQDAQTTHVIDNTATEVASTARELDSGSDRHGASDDSIPSKAGCATDAEEQRKNGDDEASQPVMNTATRLESNEIKKPSPPTGGPGGENHNSSTGVPRGVGVEHLEVPLDEGDERPSSESPTLFQNTPDAGQKDVHDHRARNSSQTGSQGREKLARHASPVGSVNVGERVRSRWFKSLFKKIPCLN